MEAPSSSEEGGPVSPCYTPPAAEGDAGPCCCNPAAAAAPIAASDANAENDDNGNDNSASWSYRLVRGSLYVTGPRVDNLAQAGKAALAAAPGLNPGLLQRAASDRELRDGQHFHITLLHRSEMSDDTSSSNKEPPSLLEASRFASSFGDSNTPPRPAPPPPDRDMISGRSDGWAAVLHRARGGAFLGSALLPTKKKEGESGNGRWLWRWAFSLLPSLLWPGAAASTLPDTAAEEEAAEALLGSYRQSALARMLQEEEEEGEEKLLMDPLPLYVYRTSGEGRSLAVALLFLPGEYMRFARGQVYRPLHTTLGFLGHDERDLDARRLGNVQKLAFLQPPETVRRVLFALCRLLRRMRACIITCHRDGDGCDSEGEENATLQGFVPRVLELAREVRTVAGMLGVPVEEEEMGLLQELLEGEAEPLRPT